MEAKKYTDEILDYADIKDSKSLEEKWNKDTENMSKEEKYKYYRKHQIEIFNAIYMILENTAVPSNKSLDGPPMLK